MEGPIKHSTLPSSAALAFLGDAVHSAYIRERAVRLGLSKSADLHNYARRYVNAASQARMYRALCEELTEDETDVFRRASNSSHLQKPKHMSILEYRRATGLEAVLGLLRYLGREERILTLLDKAQSALEAEDAETLL